MENLETGSNKGKIFLVVVLLILVALVVAVLKFSGDKMKNPIEGMTAEQMTPVEVAKRDVPEKELPDKFPADLPMENGAKVLQNYTTDSQDGRFSAVRQYETAKSIADNAKIFNDYFEKGGWKIMNSLNQENLSVLTAVKDSRQLNVTINKNAITDVTTVDLAFTELNK